VFVPIAGLVQHVILGARIIGVLEGRLLAQLRKVSAHLVS
jgi:hypothetical protein